MTVEEMSVLKESYDRVKNAPVSTEVFQGPRGGLIPAGATGDRHHPCNLHRAKVFSECIDLVNSLTISA